MPFHRFSDLPPELRLKIWKYALPGPRMIKIIAKRQYVWNRKKPGRLDRHGILHSIKQELPVLLHVCYESRELALKSYKVFTPKGDFFNGLSGYIDYNKDYLYWSECKAFKRTLTSHFFEIEAGKAGISDLLRLARVVMVKGLYLDKETCENLPNFRSLSAVFFQLDVIAIGYTAGFWKREVEDWVVKGVARHGVTRVPEIYYMKTKNMKYMPQPMEGVTWFAKRDGEIKVIPNPKPNRMNKMLEGFRRLLLE